jgi:hypothetical protein
MTIVLSLFGLSRQVVLLPHIACIRTIGYSEKKPFCFCLCRCFSYAFVVARRCSSCALIVVMGSSLTSSDLVPVLRCSVFFNGINYHNWISRICLYMRRLHLWEFLMGELPCLPPPLVPAQSMISEKTYYRL